MAERLEWVGCARRVSEVRVGGMCSPRDSSRSAEDVLAMRKTFMHFSSQGSAQHTGAEGLRRAC